MKHQKNMKQVVTIIVFLLLFFNSNGQMTPNDYVETFFKDFITNSDKAIDDIYKTNPYTAEMGDAVNNMKEVAANYPNSLGKYYGYEFLTQEKATNNFLLFSYFVRFDRQPMKFTFIFYKANDKWALYSLNFSANIDEELEQAAKDLQSKN